MGERRANLEAALAALRATPGVTVERVSSFHETPAVTLAGVDCSAPAYLNAAATLRATLPPRELLKCMLEIERRLGRDRSRETRWGPRTIDLDLLLYGDRVIEEAGLVVPHPRMHERRFVLEPLAEIAGEVVHPVLRKRVSELLAALPAPSEPRP